MSSPHVESSRVSRRAVRWLLPAALLALTPKCVLCVLAYAGAGTALGLGGPEWCRVAEDAPFSWVTALAWIGAVGLLGMAGFLTGCRRLPRVGRD